jgi:hypothetical protein
VNLEEARKLAMRVMEGSIYADPQDARATQYHLDDLAAVALKLADEVERLQFQKERLLDMVKDLERLVATPREEEA